MIGQMVMQGLTIRQWLCLKEAWHRVEIFKPTNCHALWKVFATISFIIAAV